MGLRMLKYLFILNNVKKFLLDCQKKKVKNHLATHKLFKKCSKATYDAFLVICRQASQKEIMVVQSMIELAFHKFAIEKDGLHEVTDINHKEMHPMRLFHAVVRKYDARLTHEHDTFELMKKQEMDIFSVLGALTIPLLGAGLSWTIDLPAIAGIIAAIGTGIDHQIIILDETLTGHARRIYGLKDKIKTAFFIIFGAAGTMVAAMLPLIFLVAEFVKGFAITTIIGVWIGISVTRPAYARIIESLSKEKGLVSN